MAATVGIIGAVGSVAKAGMGIFEGITGGKAAASAAREAQAQEERAMQFQQGVYSTAQTNLQPWIGGGQAALGGVEQFLGLPNTAGGAGAAGGSGALASYNQFTKTPFYTFPLKQMTGQGGTMDRAAAARGLNLSSGQLMDLGKYAGNYAGGQFGNYMQALERLSGVGQTSSTQLGQIGLGTGQQVGQTATQLGGIAIGGAQAQQGARNQMLGGIGNLFDSLSGGAKQLNDAGVFGPGGGTGSSYTASTFANPTDYTTGGFYGGNQPIV